MTIAKVALDVPLPQLFDYRCPENQEAPQVGHRVIVPFGARRATGVVVALSETADIAHERLKDIERVLAEVPPLPPAWMQLARFCSDYYQRPLGEVILNALPPRLRQARPLPARSKVLRAPSGEIDDAPISTSGHPLNEEQHAAYEAVRASFGSFAPFLLFGITGAGKTEVYLHLVAEALLEGRQALVLVPEIALTPSLEAAFGTRFPGARIAVQHSGMAEAERARGWVQSQAGEADIVLGTRLAVFVPLPRLGLIVVDEEQDMSFKQRDGLRYSARDVAVYRAREAGAPVLLVSATPSLESLQHARSEEHTSELQSH